MLNKILRYVSFLCLIILIGMGVFAYQQDKVNLIAFTESQQAIDRDFLNILTVMSNQINHNSQYADEMPNIIQKQIDKDKLNKFLMLKKLQMVNVMIIGEGTMVMESDGECHYQNREKVSWQGSGVTLKYKGKYYILSAAHLVATQDTVLKLYENEEYISTLKVVKIDKDKDLLLLVPENEDCKPKVYAELADCEPLTAQEVIAVGNPVALEDTVSYGTVIKYTDVYMIISNTTYYGSSGGGIYNMRGNLVSIVSAGGNAGHPWPDQPYYIDFEIRLNVIKEFLGDIE